MSFDVRRLTQAAAITGVVAIVANLLVYALATAIFDIPDAFSALEPGPIIGFTIIGVAAAAGVLRLLAARSSQPVASFRRLVPIALAVSLIPDVAIWVTDGFDGSASAETVLPLMVMHLIPAVASFALLPSLAARTTSAL
jgi:hypothetical protein